MKKMTISIKVSDKEGNKVAEKIGVYEFDKIKDIGYPDIQWFGEAFCSIKAELLRKEIKNGK